MPSAIKAGGISLAQRDVPIIRSLDQTDRGGTQVGAASRRRPTDRVLTAVVPLWLDRADHEMAHTGCHASALLWNAAVAWVRGEWDEGRSPGREDIRRYIETLPSEMRTLHSQTVQGIAYDLWEMIRGTQTRRRNGETNTRFPWRAKRYRPLSFTANFGWRLTPQGEFALSFGKGRRRTRRGCRSSTSTRPLRRRRARSAVAGAVCAGVGTSAGMRCAASGPTGTRWAG